MIGWSGLNSKNLIAFSIMISHTHTRFLETHLTAALYPEFASDRKELITTRITHPVPPIAFSGHDKHPIPKERNYPGDDGRRTVRNPQNCLS